MVNDDRSFVRAFFFFEKEKFISLRLFYGKEQVETFNQETRIREEKVLLIATHKEQTCFRVLS